MACWPLPIRLRTALAWLPQLSSLPQYLGAYRSVKGTCCVWCSHMSALMSCLVYGIFNLLVDSAEECEIFSNDNVCVHTALFMSHALTGDKCLE